MIEPGSSVNTINLIGATSPGPRLLDLSSGRG